jgi:hypothetical protein
MRAHTARSAEHDSFVEAAGAGCHREEVQQYVQGMFDAGCMRPE